MARGARVLGKAAATPARARSGIWDSMVGGYEMVGLEFGKLCVVEGFGFVVDD